MIAKAPALAGVVAMVSAFAVAGDAIAPAAAETLRRVLASPLVDEGSGPDGCTPALSGLGGPVVWEVRLERLLLDGKALVETSRQADPNRYPLCIADLPVAKNAEVELSFVIHAGVLARAAGLVLRFADPQDYYVAEADALDDKVRLSRVVNGERREIRARAVALAVAQAQTLKVKAVEASFSVFLDGKFLFETHDSGIATPGRFGVASRADSATGFGDLFITVLE
jgi:hypothetical protein